MDTNTTDGRLLSELTKRFWALKAQTEGAFQQLTDDEMYRAPFPGGNSVAVLLQHTGGNLRSRFQDFLTTDGEKPDRHRETEFQHRNLSREELLAIWEGGWAHLLNTLNTLQANDLHRTITIRSEPHTVTDALLRQLAHHSYHAGQIATTARWLTGERWQWQSIPPGQSEAFNVGMAAQHTTPNV